MPTSTENEAIASFSQQLLGKADELPFSSLVVDE